MNGKPRFENMTESEARGEILGLAREYCRRFHKPKAYAPGDRIPYAGRVYGEEEMAGLVDSALDFWLTAGRYAAALEKKLAARLGLARCLIVNSGSSANLLAVAALTSPLLGDRALKPGDEIITVAAGFPTTIAPILQAGLIPVFIDISIPQYNLDPSLLEQAFSPRTKAVMAAHTLGNPFDLGAVKAFCDRRRLWLIEDNCDALGSTYILNGEERLTGAFGDLGTSSFYPAHHITLGEGGAVYTDNLLLGEITASLRDWGRACSCEPGEDNRCGRRFDGQYGELPPGYDHKYVYSHFGYNLKVTDMQAAIGVAQLDRLDAFTRRRRENFQRLWESLAGLKDALILPEASPGSNPSWFGFPLTCRRPGLRDAMVAHLERQGIQTRTLFAGNMVRQPCFDGLRRSGAGYRVAGSLENTDRAMRDTFWVGVYPGLTEAMLEFMGREIIKAARGGP